MKKVIMIIFLFLVLIITVSAKSGSMKLLAVSGSEVNPEGSTADLFLEVKEGTGRVFIDSFPLSKLDTQISTRFAMEVACNFLERDCSNYDFFYTIRADSAIIGGPSASAAITILTISVLDDLPLDKAATITGTINSGGIIGPVGGVLAKIEAAGKANIKKVLIPKYSQVNQSNLTEYEKKFGLTVVEVSQLADAIKAMTGRVYNANTEFSQSTSYTDTMKEISDNLCSRAKDMATALYGNNINQTNVSAVDLLNKGYGALNLHNFYSAASYCFGSGLNSKYKELSDANLNSNQIKSKIEDMLDLIYETKNATKKKPLNTMTDLEAFMVVMDRLNEAEDQLITALRDLNDTNSSIYYLSYGIERFNSAKTWSVFFGKPGRAFNINKKVLDDSCLKKISETEERVQYIELYLPTDTNEISDTIKEAYKDYYSGDPALCLYKSSISKAKIDLILNSMSIDQSDLDSVINDRMDVVRSIIAKQNQRGIFPIVAYSYYEYATSLKDTDKYSALLYLEYALELGSLDIYFEKQKISLPRFNKEYLIVFACGVIIGILISSLVVALRKKPNHGKRR